MLMDLQFFSNFYLHWFFSNLSFFERDPYMDSPEGIRVSPHDSGVLERNFLRSKLDYTVRTVAADLRQEEHIPKMQNNVGRKSTLCVLRQPGGGVAGCHAVLGHARPTALGLVLGSAQLP